MKIFSQFTVILLLFMCGIAIGGEANFDIVAKLDSGPGNVTVMDNGRIIMMPASVLCAKIHRG